MDQMYSCRCAVDRPRERRFVFRLAGAESGTSDDRGGGESNERGSGGAMSLHVSSAS